jgi:hypothetical protein
MLSLRTAMEASMPVLPKRALLGVFVLAVVFLVVGGLSGEASAQVYRGTITFQGAPPFDLTVTVVPGGPAPYVVRFGNRVLDAGVVTANVAGTAVVGTIHSNLFLPCIFEGTYDGITATLNLDAASCGLPGVAILTRT